MDPAPKRARQRIRVEDPAPRSPVYLGLAVIGGLVLLAGAIWLTFALLKSRTDPRLPGTWKSDIETTLAELKKDNPITKEDEDKLRAFFGQMTVTYTNTTVTSEWKKSVESGSYTIVRKDRDIVIIKVQSSKSEKETEISLHFDDDDTYWIAVGGDLECFRRVK
jgi:hypothetical protein